MTAFSKHNLLELDSKQKSLSDFNGKTDEKTILNLLGKKRRLNKAHKTIFGVPYPFLKWAGGKRQLLNKLDKYFPNHFEKYIEPFMGGGAVFFYLLPERTILIDNNEELINSFKVIQKQLEELILSLKKHRNEKEYFYKIRNVDRNLEEFSKWSNVERASRTIYLNRCCFNGLYRVNSKGHFNVPFGKYKNPKFCDEKNLYAVQNALQNAKIIAGSYEKCLNFAKKGDFIYIDPPYYPISKTSSFTSYTKGNFSENEQLHLKKVVDKLNDRGCKVLVSNSYCKFITELYGDYIINQVNAKRAINCNGSKRGKINEVLIMNYLIK